jgi:hypothetical protein
MQIISRLYCDIKKVAVLISMVLCFVIIIPAILLVSLFSNCVRIFATTTRKIFDTAIFLICYYVLITASVVFCDVIKLIIIALVTNLYVLSFQTSPSVFTAIIMAPIIIANVAMVGVVTGGVILLSYNTLRVFLL